MVCVMTVHLVSAELGRIRNELVVLDLAERLWPLEPEDTALRDALRARENRLQP